MTRGEIAYKLKHKGYSYKLLGKLFNVSRQCASGIYWRHWKKIKDLDQRTCDVCGVVNNDVAWRWSHFKLCKKCECEVLKLRKVRYTREEYERQRIEKYKGRVKPLQGKRPKRAR